MTRIEKLRNIGISAHIDSGKTTLTERMLYYCGRIHEMHEVRGSDGVGATMDSDPIERKRGITIASAVTSVDWCGHVFQIIDTPGHVDFTIEVERSLRVLDGAILVLCSVGGVQSQSYTVDRQMRRYRVPRIAFINKMDRVGANPTRVVEQMRERLNANAVPLQIPIGNEEEFEGVIDLVRMEAVYFDGTFGERIRREPIPADKLTSATAARNSMLEALANTDDTHLEMLFSGEAPSEVQIRSAIRNATLAHQIVPVMFGSASKNKGVQELLDAVAYYLPSPNERPITAIDLRRSKAESDGQSLVELTCDGSKPAVAMAFKTIIEDFGPVTFVRLYQGSIGRGKTLLNTRTGHRHRFSKLVRVHANQRTEIEQAEPGDLFGVVGLDSAMGDTFASEGFHVAMENIVVPEPVIRLSIEPVRRDDADILAKALDRFRRQDPTFRCQTDSDSGQLLIAGMGRLHLDVYIQRLRDEYKCNVHVGRPQVAYKEHPTQRVEFEYRLKKQTGGPGQFAQISGRFEPLPVNSEVEFEFLDEVAGGRISRSFIPAIREGVVDALSRGLLGQHPVVGVRVVLLDGMEHEKDSSEFAFRRCAWEAIRDEVLPRAKLELLEPIVQVEIDVPLEYQGSVVGNLSRKRGTIASTAISEGVCHIESVVPLAEMLDYATEIRSLSQGKGTFTMSPTGYQPMPKKVTDESGCPSRVPKEYASN